MKAVIPQQNGFNRNDADGKPNFDRVSDFEVWRV